MADLLHNVEEITFKADQMILKIDGEKFIFDLFAISERLAKASKIEREKYEISPSGYGIHWPLIDEDLSIPGLLRTALTSAESNKNEIASASMMASKKVNYGPKR
ncbi:MAG: DUF2442 domain-containing protein [Candidatus Aminicenantes bacterium]|nr:DUF2442 domain-containing protein [Candidatus Aminicenantes bacterium]NIM83541.1 DUF2442 domain-containing protein [Candidatus Aminicenantes bacterium]NIN22930.1 DUF2442 domain-containing protein [Candidatus Aminicenantes bacterium]NIN46669.1 DUF2442 domain-containing protein [Candidatus Aminicenantes bacterium]NIN89575.1 DUF2442 domain-containing protein [Candidatus Aminicenantes bacterium]